MKKILVGVLTASSFMFAHTAIMNCFDNADGTITCEGGFSDGSSASGINFRLEQNGNTLFENRFSEESEITFNKPKGDYEAVFDAGEGHQIHIKSSDIIE